MTYDKISRNMKPPVDGAFLTERGWEIRNADGTTEVLIAIKKRNDENIISRPIITKEIETEKMSWWTNGEINIRDTKSPGKGFKKGMVRKKK